MREFGQAILGPLGAPSGPIETFIEVPFKIGEQSCSPDGLIRTRRGAKTWVALVEVKTGSSVLDREQIETYLDVARDQGFNAVITISNQLIAIPGVHPVEVSKQKLKKVSLHHLSWTRVLSEAIIQKLHRGVSDPDQAWILSELIRYLEHPQSGAMEFEDMGSPWVTVRNAAESGTLRARDTGVTEVASRWDQLIRYIALRLGRDLGADIQPALSRKELNDPSSRVRHLVEDLVQLGALKGGIRIPNAVSPLEIEADIRAGRLTLFVDLDAPRDGRSTTRVRWLLRQLKDSTADLRIDSFAAHARESNSALLGDAREDPKLLIGDPKKEIRSFRVAMGRPMGTKRGQGRGTFITSVLNAVDEFYETTVQNLRRWSAPPPRLRRDGSDADPTSEAKKSSPTEKANGSVVAGTDTTD